MSKTAKIILAALSLVVLTLAGLSGFVSRRSDVSPAPDDESVQVVELVPYQQIFEQYAPTIGWDWQLLAAVCYEESRFNPLACSHQGAQGLMQLMPKTAGRFNLNDSTVWIPKENIRAGAEYISRLQQIYSFISDSTEQTRFVLASYNAGPAHIMDARRLAKRYGRSPYVWYDNTEYWLSQLQTDTYANDSVVLFGAFSNAKETVSYVKKVSRTADRFRKMSAQYEVKKQ